MNIRNNEIWKIAYNICVKHLLLLFVTFIGIGKFCVTLGRVDRFLGHFSLLTTPTRVSWCYCSSSTWNVSSTARSSLRIEFVEINHLRRETVSSCSIYSTIDRGKICTVSSDVFTIVCSRLCWPICRKLAVRFQFSLFVTEGLCLLVFIKGQQTKVLSILCNISTSLTVKRTVAFLPVTFI
jgi:hypothetical protein